MKIYHGKGSCSLGILVILEELGLPYEVVQMDLAGREQASPDYLKRNPKAKVPLLELDDGTTLTEWPAIAVYLAMSKPEAGLLKTDALGLAKTLEATDYLVSTVHMQGFTRIARPGNFTPNEADIDTVKARGREILDAGLALMAQSLGDKPYLLGEISIADAALFYIEHWMVARLQGALPPGLQPHYARMLARDSVKRALAHN